MDIPAPSRLQVETATLPRDDNAAVEWIVLDELVPYETALAFMETRAAAIAAGEANEVVVLLEHPPIYTAGTSARASDLLDAARFPVFQTGRGGEYTYHGPGQRVAYVLLDLRRRGSDVRRFVAALEHWIVDTLAHYQIRGERREDRVGVWVRRPERAPLADGSPAEDKIAAIGIRVRRWVSFHGISLNVDPDLSHFGGIVPCGIQGYGVTSLIDLGVPVSMPEVDMVLRGSFEKVFGPSQAASGRPT
ncbi:lipoyl(octanoyl) transferase LipB [Aureimonas jatrophae]|uniref:Octanoyltransferase n=1 Tax=Aureimonas jatrophae TaxID=1166073 RepID=A0A1H0MT19_9HYPH|nr:lipoyl(octanoyl) transferase LipB [Aureimonas jatrophae]MBB3951235.1 lipoyl(octanoyl) transferase [Aureimonas jatrophae]SDO83598.1 lipoyl(octanoyl) transferase [Aureimonas jatrophae]